MTIGTRLFTWLHGRLVGRDEAGNRYYEDRKGIGQGQGAKPRRWVMYAGYPEASKVPPEWHCWLHYTTEAPLPASERQPWQTAYVPNMTGTAASYRPPGHDYRGGHRSPATGDYEAWTPES